jgi:DUF4097 and DUF4098 domain-containing protein YvlB
MPTFDTPGPIRATIHLAAGTLRIIASDRTDTVVEVRPDDDEDDDAGGQAAEQTQVEYANGRLVVKGPTNKARWWLFSWHPSIEVTIELPTGSSVDAHAASADVNGSGRLGESRFTTSSGDIWLDQIGKLPMESAGTVPVARSDGPTYVTTSDGEIRIGEIDGMAVVKAASGDITLGQVTGDLRLSTASGDITVDRALASVSAKTAHGSVRIGEVVRGSVVLETASGELEIGIREGTAAWLDLHTVHGSVRSSLNPADGPAPSDETVEVRARTSDGDIVIRRS